MISPGDEAIPLLMKWKDDGTPLLISFASSQVSFSAVASLTLRSDEEALEFASESCSLTTAVSLKDCELATISAGRGVEISLTAGTLFTVSETKRGSS
jgi:hypothetical protein